MMTTRTLRLLRFCSLCTRKEGVKIFCEEGITTRNLDASDAAMTTAKKKMYDESVHDCVINISKETQLLTTKIH